MPFTFCHPAAVLPLMRRPFVPAALVAGTMAPDLPYYVPSEVYDALTYPGAWYFRAFDAGSTHGVTGMFGMFGFDLLVAAALVGLFRLCRRPLPLLLPGRVAARLPAPAPRGGRGPSLLLWAPLSALIGIGTHIAWDATTKSAVANALPFLREPVLGGTDGLTLVSYANTLVGGLIVAWWLWRHRAPARPARAVGSLPPSVRWAVLACLLVAVGVAAALPVPGGASLRVLVVRVIGAAVVVLVGYAAAWHLARGRRQSLQEAPLGGVRSSMR